MATGDFLINQGATLTFDSGGTTISFTPTSVASGAGRVSAACDLTSAGPALGPGLYWWGAKTKFATSPVVGEAIDIYLGLSDGTNDFNVTQSDTGVSSEDTLKGAMWIGQILVNEATTTNSITAFGEVFIPVPQVQVIWWNGTADALSATAGDHAFYLAPIPYNESA